MPMLGEVTYGRYIHRLKTPNQLFIWSACIECGFERWVQHRRARPDHNNRLCKSCSSKVKMIPRKFDKSPCWKGGRIVNYQGYIQIKLPPDDFFYPMTHNGYVKEHRLVMAKYLGRNLHLWEIVHHIDGSRQHNDLSNLRLIGDDRHKQITLLKAKIDKLEAQVAKLKAANAK